tara:strand:- start:770 stop:1009 length:240 start_codon:yes stop_codon:yes gene_type:complete
VSSEIDVGKNLFSSLLLKMKAALIATLCAVASATQVTIIIFITNQDIFFAFQLQLPTPPVIQSVSTNIKNANPIFTFFY